MVDLWVKEDFHPYFSASAVPLTLMGVMTGSLGYIKVLCAPLLKPHALECYYYGNYSTIGLGQKAPPQSSTENASMPVSPPKKHKQHDKKMVRIFLMVSKQTVD